MCVYCRLNEKKDSKYIIRKDGKYAMTEDGKKVPKICPECGAEMTLQIKGEPIYICKNDHYFGTMKFSLKEGFEFNSVNKSKKKLNAVDVIFWDKLNAIAEKIINYNKNTILSYDEKEFMLSLAPGTYLTNDEDINPLVRNYIKIFGYDCDLNWIDTSNVTDMSYLFDEIRSFTGNVSEWDVSNVTNMGNMFGSTNFNGDISKWDVSNVTDMDSMFEFSLFNGDISNWDVSNVTDMSYMFMESQFNGDISKWDVSNVEVMTCMFYKSQFNGDISKWDVSHVINMKRMFYKSPFSGNLDNWDVSKVSNLSKIFQKTPLESNPPLWYTKKVNGWNGVLKESFDFDSVNKQKKSINAYDAILTKIVQKILYKSRLSKEDKNVILSLPVASYKTNDSEIHLLIEKCIEFFGPTCNLNWIDTSNVTNMKRLFWETEFNGDISQWNVSNVTDMTSMFCSSKDSFYAFNGDLNNWDVSNVATMECMFMGACGANPSISKWDVSNVKDMYQMFAWNQKFDGDISNWNVSNVTNMALMFYESGFNGNLSKWDVSKVQDMHGMFSSSYFKGNNGSLGNWNVSNVTNMSSMFNQTNFNGDISNWDVRNVLHMNGMFYNSTFNRDISNWNICPAADTGQMFDRCDIIDEYKPKNFIKESFDFDSIDKGKKTVNIYNNVYPIIEKIINYKKINNISKEEYNQLISYTGIYKPLNKEELKIIIKKFINYFGTKCCLNWIDVSNITDMYELFYNSKFNGDISQWDVSNVTDMRHMFQSTHFNGDISQWDVSNVANMYKMFQESKFNGDISQWDVGNVKNMRLMFYKSEFNNDISKWNVSNVTDMSNMFDNSVFNQDISQWDVSNVTNMCAMFERSVFNQDISQWNVSNVTNMSWMFAWNKKFDNDISNWRINGNCDKSNMFQGCSIKDEYKPKKLIKESFDFDSINKGKKPINAYEKLPSILEKVTEYKDLTKDEYYILTSMVGIYKVKNTDKLKSVKNYFIKQYGNNCDLNWIDVSNITDMSYLFFQYDFNGDISQWNVSNVTNMKGMFSHSGFNGDISNWNVSNVTNMKAMFWKSKFNSDISSWDVSNVMELQAMFMETEFNQDISNWHFNDNAITTDMFMACPIKNEYKPKMMRVNEAFDFHSVNKQKKQINAYDTIYPIIKKIIVNEINNISNDEYNQLTSYVGIYKPQNTEELKSIIKKFIDYFGDYCNLNWIDVSNITDMSYLFSGDQKHFKYNEFNGDISKWDVSNVTNMNEMFKYSYFNGDISNWDVSNVTNMRAMFMLSLFNNDISQWNVSNVTNMEWMFHRAKFNKDISKWDVSNVTTMVCMFSNSVFTGDISKWDVSNVTDMECLFGDSKFNGDISKWNVSNVTKMGGMFTNSPFNGDISRWNICNVKNMIGMFRFAVFNGDISQWDVSNVTNMANMFHAAKFNGDISQWDVSNVTNMQGMFIESEFNNDISKWDVSNVTDMAFMFDKTPFNNDISNWNINSKCKTNNMFRSCPIKNEYMPKMLRMNEAFDFGTIINKKQHVNIFDKVFPIIEKIIKKGRITNISDAEYDLLIQYTGIYKPANKQELKSIISKFIKYFGNNCNLNWIDVSGIINMDYLFNESKFNGDISQWDASNVITMREMFSYSKFTGDISNWDVSNVTNMQTMFACSKFNGDISQWEVSNVTNMSGMFNNSEFNGDISQWDVSNVTDMSYMFQGTHFNGDISRWDVSNVTDMSSMFYANSVFNQDISNWNVSNVTAMNFMFAKTNFNGNISKWDVSNVINMHCMFKDSKFNGDISQWDVSNVTDMHCMFYANSVFNYDISNWDVKKVKEIGDMFKNSMIQNEYKPKFNITEAFDFSSINDTRSKDALKTIERLQHEQDFIDVPKIKGPELTKLKGFVAGMQKTDPEIHYTYTQDKDNVNGRILKIFTNNHVLHMFVKKYLALKNFLDSKGIDLKIIPVCDQGKLNIWYTGQTELGIAPNEYQFDLDTNASVLKGWKINNIILDGFVVSFWSTYDNEGGRSGQQLYQLAHNSQHVYLYNCSYSPNKNEMNKRVANVLHHKLKHLKHSTLHLKAAIGSINNGKDVDILALKWLGEAFDFNALKDTRKTGIQRTVDAYIETAFKTDIIAAKTTAVRKAIEGYIKSIKRYDRYNTLFFEYTEDDNILKIKMVNPNQELCFNTSPLIRLSSKMFNLGKSLPKIEFIPWKRGAKILNIHLNTGLSMEVIATKGHSLTYYIEHGLYMLDLKHIAINNLILDRFVLNDEDISYLYDLNVKHIFTPKTRFTGVTKMINYKEFMNFPHISFTNNQGKTPKGLFMDEIEQVSNYE